MNCSSHLKAIVNRMRRKGHENKDASFFCFLLIFLLINLLQEDCQYV